jgi:nucleoside-diphosphate-sugar epimerase
VLQPDITRARQVLHWQPAVDLEEGLRRTVGSLVGEVGKLPSPLPTVRG